MRGGLKPAFAAGYRNNGSGGINNVGSNGNYWLASSNSQQNAYNLNFNSSDVNPQNNNNRANGFSVRPVARPQHLNPVPNTVMILSRDALYDKLMDAYLAARKNERNNPSQIEFELNLESNLWDLREELINRRYKPSPLVCFIIYEPVMREVFAPAFRDRVVSHFLFNEVSQLFERTFIYDSYSCRVGKGTLFGIERAEHHIRSCTNNYTRKGYGLSLDISGYFMSINRATLLNMAISALERFRGKRNKQHVLYDAVIDFNLIYYLFETILLRNPLDDCRVVGQWSEWLKLPRNKSLFFAPCGVGLIIGDLMSQLFSNVYLNPLDNYIKRELHVKHYGRYVDDAYLMHNDKEFLLSLIPRISDFLDKKLGLKLNMKKVHVFDLSQNFIFLGACIKPYRRYTKNRSIKSFHKRVKCIEESIYRKRISNEDLYGYRSSLNSYCGYLGKFKCWKIMDEALKNSVIRNYFHFTEGYKKAVIFKDKLTDNV